MDPKALHIYAVVQKYTLEAELNMINQEALLATIHGCKGMVGGVYDGRILTPKPGTLDPKHYLVQHVEPDWPFMDIPREYVYSNAKHTESGAQISEVDVCVDHIYAVDLVRSLSIARADLRADWTKVAMILKQADNGGDVLFQE